MEASLASPTVKESFTTTLTSLPPELLADVAAHLPLGSLACFSLVSRFVREAVQPKLYHKVELRCDGATELQERRREAVRATLKLLGEDEKRCEMLRELDLREWAWMDDAETKDLAAVSRSARRLTALRLENSPSDLESYIPVFQPVWDAVLALPDLTRLACSGGPLVPLHLHRNSALRRLEITNYTMVPNEDGALPALHHLHLDNVGGFTEEWFAPKLLESLRVLTLANLDLAGAKVVLSLFTVRSTTTVWKPEPR
ncbi:hypothetical protein BCR35DRAFT_219659 [Leucosporidium creatinivorum]|uniref:F-box domain-containing protein n=1 Tax=Leucosporidium creatinivorum TaxID=106004 RepID=A0A1Y2FXD1_9BASI|nr:hypothetical protein BCR35DRAFT_219659 [Leucosporidium creatinivorum]